MGDEDFNVCNHRDTLCFEVFVDCGEFCVLRVERAQLVVCFIFFKLEFLREDVLLVGEFSERGLEDFALLLEDLRLFFVGFDEAVFEEQLLNLASQFSDFIVRCAGLLLQLLLKC